MKTTLRNLQRQFVATREPLSRLLARATKDLQFRRDKLPVRRA